MKAIVCTKYGAPNVLEYVDVQKPTPKDQDILIKVHATVVTAADCMMRQGVPKYGRLFLGLSKPKFPIPGTGFAGTVEEVGKEVDGFKVGDKVFGETGVSFSANAEFVCVSNKGLIEKIPEGLSFEQAASMCDGPLTSISFLKDIGKIQPGQKVLVNGASGSLGSAAVQIAKSLGAYVVGVCSAANVEMVKSLGADETLDYTKEDFTLNKKQYDIIYDTVGKSAYSKCKQALKPNGMYLSPVLTMPLLFQMMASSLFSSKKAKFSATGMRPVPELAPLLKELVQMCSDGKLSFIIDKRLPLEKVPEAHEYVDTGRKKGNVVILLEVS